MSQAPDNPERAIRSVGIHYRRAEANVAAELHRIQPCSNPLANVVLAGIYYLGLFILGVRLLDINESYPVFFDQLLYYESLSQVSVRNLIRFGYQVDQFQFLPEEQADLVSCFLQAEPSGHNPLIQEVSTCVNETCYPDREKNQRHG